MSTHGTSLCFPFALQGAGRQRDSGRTSRFRRQRGAAALEFGLVFPLFFVLFYGIVAYSLIMTLEQSLTHAAAEGARAAVAVDPADFVDDEAYKNKIKETACVTASGALAWLPDPLECTPEFQSDSGITTVTVTLKYSLPSVPVIKFPLLPKIPDVPDPLVASANTQL